MNKFLFLIVFFISWTLMAQEKTVKGTVTDDQGVPIPGVSIVIKNNTSKGTSTDIDGKYSIKVSPEAILVFSYLGFQTKEISAKRGVVIDVQLKESTQQLEDVVIVGHGTQKKVSVSGAITSVKGGDLRLPSSSLTTAFAGQLAGVIAMTRSGEPGSASEFYIRGISTFGGRATPLIMLDDVEISTADLNNIPAETIESFSILKDASATAIYGSRGANGVMLIKTKNGSKNQKTKVGITFDQYINTPVNFPDFVDGATWMELYNEALLSRNSLATPKYSDERINATRLGINPYVYPDVNWKKTLFKDMAINHRVNMNIQGGGEKATYYMSIQATHDEGLLKTKKIYSWDNNINNWGYNFQNNISYNLSPNTTIDLRMNAQIRQSEGPNFSTRELSPSLDNLFAQILSANPVNFPIYFPTQEGDTHVRFGSSVLSGSNYRKNPFAILNTGYRETRDNTLNTSLKIRQDLGFLTEGLRATLLVNFKNWSNNGYFRWIDPYLYKVKDGSYDPNTQKYELERLGTGGTDFISTSAKLLNGDQTFVLQGTVDYAKRFGDHSLEGMILYQQREFKSNILPHRNQGYSGRLMYNFKNKYFTEFNFGYTGTERLAKGNRFEFFPAASIGWVVSDEKFFSPLSNVVSFLKLRTSYGIIGSDETGANAGAQHFLYLDRISLAVNDHRFYTGENLGFSLTGPQVIEWKVDNARWEKVKKFNIGADMNLFNNSLKLTADYFYDHRYDILLKREAWPQSLGYHTAKPWANKGKVDNWGYELSANWSKEITDDLKMELRGNFTYTQNKYVDIDDPVYKYPWQSRTGKPLSYTTGFISEGLFSSQDEINNSPDQTQLGSFPKPGDIKYRDINGDGIITNDDQTMISEYGRVPRIQYGFGINIFYKKFDVQVFFNGSAKRTIMTGLLNPFGVNDNHVFQYIADNRWTESNPNPNAAYPRLGLQASETDNNNKNSTFWMRDGSFIRFRTLEIGYTFKNGRVYFTGNNLALFSKFKQWDPELNWYNYPLQRIYSIGTQLNF